VPARRSRYTPEQKAALARGITDAAVRVLGGSPAGVDIVFCAIAKGDWATGGMLRIEMRPPARLT
jgi:4-oxalocrotonate tautomerase